MERCNNCYKYPFCNDIKESTGKCDNWKSKTRELQLIEAQNYNFKFEEIYKYGR